MPALDFMSRYDCTQPRSAHDPGLAEEGFQLYQPKGKVWAHKLTAAEVEAHFPAGRFMGKWGGAIAVQATDMLAMPYPNGGEIYVIKHALFCNTYAPGRGTLTACRPAGGFELKGRRSIRHFPGF